MVAPLENTITINKAVGATLREVPSFILSDWGPKIHNFVKVSPDFSVSMAFLKALKNQNGVNINQYDATSLFPKEVFSFFSGKKEGVELAISPRLNEVIITQKVRAGRKNSLLKKSVYIRMDDNCLVNDVAFIETFKAPNTDTASRVVEVKFNPGGTVERVRDIREINSRIHYVASGLPSLPHSFNVTDGRSRNDNIIYVWDKNNPEPIIEHVEDVEKSHRMDVHSYPFKLFTQKSRKAEIGISRANMGTENYPYGHLSKMLPPDHSLGKLLK